MAASPASRAGADFISMGTVCSGAEESGDVGAIDGRDAFTPPSRASSASIFWIAASKARRSPAISASSTRSAGRANFAKRSSRTLSYVLRRLSQLPSEREIFEQEGIIIVHGEPPLSQHARIRFCLRRSPAGAPEYYRTAVRCPGEQMRQRAPPWRITIYVYSKPTVATVLETSPLSGSRAPRNTSTVAAIRSSSAGWKMRR